MNGGQKGDGTGYQAGFRNAPGATAPADRLAIVQVFRLFSRRPVQTARAFFSEGHQGPASLDRKGLPQTGRIIFFNVALQLIFGE